MKRAVWMFATASNDAMADIDIESTIVIAIDPDVDPEQENHVIDVDVDSSSLQRRVQRMGYTFVSIADVFAVNPSTQRWVRK